MRRFAKPALTLFLAALLFSGCDGLGMQETTEPTKVERISMMVDENTIRDMERDYPDLNYADLSGSECYHCCLRRPQSPSAGALPCPPGRHGGRAGCPEPGAGAGGL